MISIIVISSNDEELNDSTIKLLNDQNVNKINIQIIVADLTKNKSQALINASEIFTNYVYFKFSENDENYIISECLKIASKEFFTVVYCGDKFSKTYFSKMQQELKEYNYPSISIAKSYFKNNKKAKKSKKKSELQEIVRLYRNNIAWYLEGSIINTSFFKKIFDIGLGIDSIKNALINMILKEKCILYVSSEYYLYISPKDNNHSEFKEVFNKKWYYESFTNFLIPLLENIKQNKNQIPSFLQRFALFLLFCRLQANKDNRNKHVLNSEESRNYYKLIYEVLNYIDNETIACVHNNFFKLDFMDQVLFFKIKVNDFDLKPNIIYTKHYLFFSFKNLILCSLDKIKVNILLMDYHNDTLIIDGTFYDILNEELFFYVEYDGDKYYVEYNELYTSTKYFGQRAYRKNSFNVKIPINKSKKISKIKFYLEHKNIKYQIYPEYKSHTSRLSTTLGFDYWPIDKKFIVYHKKGIITIKKANNFVRIYRQLRIFYQLLKSKRRHAKLVFFARMAYWITKPFFIKKNTWLFFDKIYKAGDSSEYLFKYAYKQKDKIKKYYLIDKNCSDTQRLKKEGYKLLYRNTLMHRLVFLNANVLVSSNSTVFAFNNFSLEISSYFRGIIDFHVMCVQHGLSVQNIAIAQKRLRDNIRLYFCASKYEIENLSKPVYNYFGYDILKLTGIPRYDGLVNDDKKQIIISPTWRMQAASLVTKNEGVERDYNPNFKYTEYYKVYNSLINDKRLHLISQKFGYKIIYVLHPIVSPQKKDFLENECVKIIASTSDLSYEKLFCESSLMITDYSGIQFDFAYLKKPIMYLHNNYIEPHYEEGIFNYENMGFGEIVNTNDELINLLEEYMKNECIMKQEYIKRVENFFEFKDRNNCERIYTELINYQNKNIKCIN